MDILTIDDAVKYLYSFERRAANFIDMDLPHERLRKPGYTKDLIASLGQADQGQFNIKVTGSKGKGSVSKLIASILQSQGYKVGLFTGPHLIRFNERIRINDGMISDESLIKYTKLVRPLVNEMMEEAPDDHYISKVGISLAMALKYFEDEETDFNILEMGIGAQYDEVNMAQAQISVINPIFSEHLRELSGTFEAVATSKSYIIEVSQVATFWSKQDPLAQEILEARAQDQGVASYQYGQDFIADGVDIQADGMTFDFHLKDGPSIGGIGLNMLGSHQAENASLALAVAKEAMQAQGQKGLDIGAFKETLVQIETTGRFEILSQDPLLVLDGAINRKCASHIKATLIELGSQDNIFIIGVPDDKDYLGTIQELEPLAKAIILTKAKNKDLHFHLNQYDLVKGKLDLEELYYSENIEQALALASQVSQDGDSLIIVGTQSLIGDTKKLLDPEDLIQSDISLAL